MNANNFTSRDEAWRAGMTTLNAATGARSDLGLFVLGELARLVFQHHRNAIANRKRQPVGTAQQFRIEGCTIGRAAAAALAQRALADGAEQNVKQS